MLDDGQSVDGLILYIKKIFHDSIDLIVEEIEWQDNPVVICYYSVMNDAYGMANWLPEYVKMEPRLVIIGEGIEMIKYEVVNPKLDEI